LKCWHFALETHVEEIAAAIYRLLARPLVMKIRNGWFAAMMALMHHLVIAPYLTDAAVQN